MKNINYIFTNLNELKEFIDTNNMKSSKNILVQIFSGIVDESLTHTIAKTIKERLPDASLIGTTSAGEIVDGKILDEQIIISFSLFDTTKIKSKLYFNEGEAKCAAQIIDDLVVENTKAIIIFSDGLHSNGEEILRQITLLHPDLIIAGGRAGDYHKFERTFVFDENSATEYGFVVASLSGDELIVHNNYMLNWETIGENMLVTKSDKNHLFTINNIPAVEIYKKYLGEEVSGSLPESGIEFPLITKRGNVDVARAPVALLENGSLLFGGNINEGEEVKFGFGNLDLIRNRSFDDYNYFKTLPIEATFIYSCSARKALLGTDLEVEFNFLQNISPTIGFFTYGEYFHSKSINELLNITTTFLSLSETNVVSKREEFVSYKESTTNRALKALSHLVSVTSQELNEINDTLHLKIQENEKIKNNLYKAQKLTHIGSWEWNIKSGELTWSDEIYRIFGLEPQQFEATYEAFLEFIHPEDREVVTKAVEAAIEKDIQYKIRHRTLRADGSVRIVDEIGEITRDKNGTPLFMLGTVQDVTETVNIQNELESYKNSLELKVEEQTKKRREQEIMLMQQSRLASMGEMIGNIAHQWRQPLNALSLVVANVKDAFLLERLDEAYLNKASDKANRLIQKMSATIDDFRDFFRPDKEKKNFSISSAVEDALQLVEVLLNNRDIRVEAQLDETICIEGYHNEFSQVILNIINNAKDALVQNRTEERAIKIELSSKSGKAILSISDNAGGIPEAIIHRIFEPYYTTKEQGQGTGIGLYMSKLIIEDHMSGNIKAENIKNGEGEVTGAKFIIEI